MHPIVVEVMEQGMSANSPVPENAVSPASRKEVPSLNSIGTSLPPARTQGAGQTSLVAVWTNRIATILFVSLCAVFGVLMVILPWTPKWTDNYLLISYPGVRDFMENGFVRGMASGFGLIDIWIGFSEASHYQEPEVR